MAIYGIFYFYFFVIFWPYIGYISSIFVHVCERGKGWGVGGTGGGASLAHMKNIGIYLYIITHLQLSSTKFQLIATNLQLNYN